MKYIMAQPSIKRFEWEIQVSIYSLIKQGVDVSDIIVLFSKDNMEVINNIKKLNVNVYYYDDDRYDKEYIPSLKPYLMYRYLEEDKERENEIYFYMDSDVVFTELPKVVSYDYEHPLIWYGSDCNGYLNYDYIMSCKHGEDILNGMCEIVGISPSIVKYINDNSIGAQYIVVKPHFEYFKKVYEDSIELWKYIKDKDTDLQKWTAEMWATLWNMMLFEILPKVSYDLDFTWATDDIDLWNNQKIYHNAGVTEDMKDLFFKGKYTENTPFEDDLTFVNKNKASYEYTKLIQETKDWLNS